MVQRVGAVWLAVIALYGVSGLISPGMLQLSQAINILQISAFLGIVATGQTLALLVGGIDLSVAGVVTMSNIVSTSVMAGLPQNLWIGVFMSLSLAGMVGVINGVLVTMFRISPLVATLGMNSILFGSALVYTQGAPHGAISPGFDLLGRGHISGLPLSTISWLIIAIAMIWVTRQTVFGRYLYAIGANSTAAYLNGIPIRFTKICAYALSSILAAFCGLLLTSYIGSPSLGIGEQFLLTSVAAAVVGGTSLNGGLGSISGTVGGTIFVTELNSFTNIVRVSSGTQFILQGAVIALSVLLYRSVSTVRHNHSFP
ncbi:MAG: ABC transporter permease [Verrucomicrobia bacterium]|nr:ABC transporter permease [Verrucomicrobiota bacterium]